MDKKHTEILRKQQKLQKLKEELRFYYVSCRALFAEYHSDIKMQEIREEIERLEKELPKVYIVKSED